MPNRILKDTVNESKGLSEVSPFAQDLYKRLITYADDYGRFNADVEIMRARLFPRELEAVTEADIEEALLELVGVQKLRLYTTAASSRGWMGDIIYGYFPNWGEHQRQRETRAKCPDPEHEEINDWALRRVVLTALKALIFERDAFTCQECGVVFALPGVPTKRAIRLLAGALHVDHIVPVIQGGRATEENLRLLCAACNLKRPKRAAFEELRQLAANGGEPPPPAPDDRSRIQPRAGAESDPNPETKPKANPGVARAREAAPDGAPPPLRMVSRDPVPKPTPQPTGVALFVDAVRALDPDLTVFGDRGHLGSRLKANPEVDIGLLAEAYVSFCHGEWPGSTKLVQTGDPAWVIGDLGGYVRWKRAAQEPATPPESDSAYAFLEDASRLTA